MDQARQSPQTLNELLSEAAMFLSMAPDEGIAMKLEKLRRELYANPSAEVEVEILSLREVTRRRVARTARAR